MVSDRQLSKRKLQSSVLEDKIMFGKHFQPLTSSSLYLEIEAKIMNGMLFGFRGSYLVLLRSLMFGVAVSFSS